MISSIYEGIFGSELLMCVYMYKTSIGGKVIRHLFSWSKTLKGPSISEKMVRVLSAKCLVLQSEEKGIKLSWESLQEKCNQRQVFLALRKHLERHFNWRLQLLNQGIAYKAAVPNNCLQWTVFVPQFREPAPAGQFWAQLHRLGAALQWL